MPASDVADTLVDLWLMNAELGEMAVASFRRLGMGWTFLEGVVLEGLLQEGRG